MPTNQQFLIYANVENVISQQQWHCAETSGSKGKKLQEKFPVKEPIKLEKLSFGIKFKIVKIYQTRARLRSRFREFLANCLWLFQNPRLQLQFSLFFLIQRGERDGRHFEIWNERMMQNNRNANVFMSFLLTQRTPQLFNLNNKSNTKSWTQKM